MSIADMKRLHCEIRRYGPNTLHCAYSDASRPNGTVGVLEKGLMVGSLEQDDPNNRQIPIQCWLRICTSAAQIWHSWNEIC
jgi:hypothetical protein